MCGGGGDALADPNPTLLVAFVVISLGMRVQPNVPRERWDTLLHPNHIHTSSHPTPAHDPTWR